MGSLEPLALRSPPARNDALPLSARPRVLSLAKNAGLNVLGQVLPALVGVIAIPHVVHGLGAERFGVLSIAWVLLSYFGVIDLGLGRATTQHVAVRLGAGRSDEIATVVWTSCGLQLLLGVMGGTLLAASAPLLPALLLKVPPDLTGEATALLCWLALASPVVVTSGSLRGALEGAQRFDIVNGIKIPSTSLVFVLPAVVAARGGGLDAVGAVLFLVLLATGLAYLASVLLVVPSLRRGVTLDRTLVRSFLSFGGWVTVSTLVVPVLIYSDRFLIAATLSMSAVAYYTAAYEVAARLLICPTSLSAALFPAFGANIHQRRVLQELYGRCLKYLLVIMGPVTLLLVLYAYPLLEYWLGLDYAVHATGPFQWLALGMLITSVAHIPAGLLDAVGRPDLRAKTFLAYVVPYLMVAFVLIAQAGIVGAAVAWTLRGVVEASVFTAIAWRLLGVHAGEWLRRVIRGRLLAFGGLAGAALAVQTWLDGALGLRLLGHAACLLMYGLVAWHHVLDDQERTGLRRVLTRLGLPEETRHA